MLIEWDTKKNQTNYEKHGLSFEDADLIFGSKTITFRDDRKDYGEQRFITLGELKSRVIVVVHTQRDLATRVISMRKANEYEKKSILSDLRKSVTLRIDHDVLEFFKHQGRGYQTLINAVLKTYAHTKQQHSKHKHK